MFDFYETDTSGSSSEKTGIICSYNHDLGDSNVYIASSICAGFDFYTDTFYDDFIDKNFNQYKFVVFNPYGDAYLIDKSNDNPESAITDTTTSPAATNSRHRVAKEEMEVVFQAYKTYQERFEQFLADNMIPNKDGTGYVKTYDELMDLGGYDEWKCHAFTRAQDGNADKAFCYWHGPLNSAVKTEKSMLGLSYADVGYLTQDKIDSLKSPHSEDNNKINKRIFILTDQNAEAARQADWRDHMDDAGRIFAETAKIKGVGEEAFKGDTFIQNITLGKGITYIGDKAFEDSSALVSVTMEEVSYIGDRVFYGCNRFQTVKFYDNLKVIGNEAFGNCQTLGSIEIPNMVQEIGFGAFYNCAAMGSVKITNSVVCKLGDYAFYNTKSLNTVDFSGASNAVSFGKACFAMQDAGGESLVSFTFPKWIENLKTPVYGADIDLFESTDQIKGAAAEATIPENIDTSSAADMESLRTKCLYESRIGDYLFANRTGLLEVNLDVMGIADNERLPMNTFMGCTKLTKLNIQSDPARRESKLGFDANIFRDVTAQNICVYGPKNVERGYTKPDPSTENKSDYAKPRMCTWATYSEASDYVPYCYTDNDGDHYEVGEQTSDGAFLFDLKLRDDTSASIKSCTYLGDLTSSGKTFGTEDEPFCIPDIVANKQVVALEPGSLDPVKDYIRFLEVPDNSLTSLGEKVFNNSAALEGVKLGDSVTSVGKECFAESTKLKKVTIGEGIINVGEAAFKGCSALEDVYWDRPSDESIEPAWAETTRTIGLDAFKTGADNNTGVLYFHGSVKSADYEPFRFAMTPGNVINGNGTHICYMSPTPGDMTDAEACPHMTDAERKSRIQTMSMVTFELYNGTNKVMLIDYPRFQELPDSLKTAVNNGDKNKLSVNEQKLVESTMFVDVPLVVQSIDVKRFIEADNNDVRYIDNSTATKALYGVTKRELYGGNGTGGSTTSKLSMFAKGTPDVTHPGLFSGEATDSVNALHTVNPSFTPASSRGNDWVQTINLPKVEALPDYCFDSCEMLYYVNLGDELGRGSTITENNSNYIYDSIGEKVFHGCDNLLTLGTSYNNPDGNPYLSFDNMILYRHDLNSTEQELVACLPGRGDIGGQSEISPANDAAYLNDVYVIKSGAFDGCKDIGIVDLSGAEKLAVIIENCFEDCEMLSQVMLSDYVTDVKEGAFYGCCNGLTVKIPSMTTEIEPDAFDDYDKTRKNNYYIKTPEGSRGYYCTIESGKGPSHIHWEPISNIIVSFWKDQDSIGITLFDNTPNSQQKFENTPAMAQCPDTSAVSDFKEWVWIDKNGIKKTGVDAWTNIMEDRNIFATYEEPVVPTPADCRIEFLDDIGGGIIAVTQPQGTTNYIPPKYEQGLQTKIAGRNPDEWEWDCWMCYEGTNPGARDSIYGATINTNWRCVAQFKQKGSASSNTPTPVPSGEATGTPTPTTRPGTTGTPTPTPTTKPGTTGTPTPTVSGNNPTYSGKMYYATVENGSGSGQYPAGSVITVTAYSAPEGRTFDRWTTSNTDIGMSNILAVSTTFIMPSHDVKVTATYKGIAASGNSVTPAPIRVVSGDTVIYVTPTPVPGRGGTEVRITTDTIDNNKKNMGSASVSGSTDNFIVKVTDSAAATAAVEAAFRNAYGERFTDLRYAAFDISLYDSTGTYVVQNANNLAVTITLPIPEALLSYAGNNKAGAVINGQLQELAVSYTTIDGVPCMRFTATHFSPYTIFVDTKNVVRGITDNTPKTGDGIAPKWFLSGGMLSMSAVLFLWKDKNPIIEEEKKKRRRPSGK